MGRLFGTDGVRGIANKELTPELAFNLGKAGTFVLKKNAARPVIVIGKDTRVSGDMLENALTAGILAVGGNVIKAGVIPTPAVAYLARCYNADAGIVISASHNTFEYNGIKFFNGNGFKLDDLLEEKIEDLIISSVDVNSHITGEEIGKCLEAEGNALELYANHLLETADFRLDGKKVVLDRIKLLFFEENRGNFVLCKIPRHRALPSIGGLSFSFCSAILIFFYSALTSSILSPVILAIISASIFSFFMLFAILSAAFCSPHSSPFVNPDFSPLQNPDFSPSFNPAS